MDRLLDIYRPDVQPVCRRESVEYGAKSLSLGALSSFECGGGTGLGYITMWPRNSKIGRLYERGSLHENDFDGYRGVPGVDLRDRQHPGRLGPGAIAAADARAARRRTEC